MTFQQLNFIVEVSRYGSINKAAEKLYISQSNISNSIKELENELNIIIFNRTNRGVQLTKQGREFLTFIKPILEQREKINKYYTNSKLEPLLTFNVSSQRYPFTIYAFTEFVKNKNISKYNMCIKETDMYRVIDDVFNNQSDIGIIFISEATEKYILKVLKIKNIEFNELIKVKPHVFVSKVHPIANKKEIDLIELSDYPYVKFTQENGMPLDYSEEVSLIDFNMYKKVIRINDRATAYNIIANTDSFSIGTGIIPNGYGDERIVTIPINNNNQYMKLGWIKLRNKKNSQEIDEFIKYLKNTIDNTITPIN